MCIYLYVQYKTRLITQCTQRCPVTSYCSLTVDDFSCWDAASITWAGEWIGILQNFATVGQGQSELEVDRLDHRAVDKGRKPQTPQGRGAAKAH